MGSILVVNILTRAIMCFYIIQTIASMNYFDSSRKNLTYIFQWMSVTEMHVITKFTNRHVYSCFSYINN